MEDVVEVPVDVDEAEVEETEENEIQKKIIAYRVCVRISPTIWDVLRWRGAYLTYLELSRESDNKLSLFKFT
jgi:hypothetical protein